MNKELANYSLTIISSAFTSWIAARHYYLADVEKKFDTLKELNKDTKGDIKDLRSEFNTRLDNLQKDIKDDLKEINRHMINNSKQA